MSLVRELRHTGGDRRTPGLEGLSARLGPTLSTVERSPESRSTGDQGSQLRDAIRRLSRRSETELGRRVALDAITAATRDLEIYAVFLPEQRQVVRLRSLTEPIEGELAAVSGVSVSRRS
jgi:hypothetical protein